MRYRKLALAEPPLKGTAMKAPSLSLRMPFLRGFVRGVGTRLEDRPLLERLKNRPPLSTRCRAGGQDLEVARALEEPRRFR